MIPLRLLRPVRFLPTLFLLVGGGCVYMPSPRFELAPGSMQSAEQVLATYFVASALGPDPQALPALVAFYPPRAQLVTYALIAHHHENGAWPADAPALQRFLAESPANPALPADALAGFQISTQADGSCTYSTSEDRQRGRFFTVGADYRVTFPIPANPFAGASAEELPHPFPGSGSTITINWGKDHPPQAATETRSTNAK